MILFMEQRDLPVDNVKGLIWSLISMCGASVMAISLRGASETIDSNLIAGFRSGGMLVLVVIAIICVPKLRHQLRFSQPLRHIVRGIFFGGSTLFGFYAFSQIPLSTATVLFFTGPIFATILSVIFQKQTIGPRRIIAIIAGFVGALIVLRPGVIPLDFGMLSALLSSLCFAIVLIMSRSLSRIDGTLSTMTSSTFITFIICIPFILMGSELSEIPKLFEFRITWGWLIILLVVSVIRQFADIMAYKMADSSIIAPIAYLRLVFISIAAYFLFGEVLDIWTIVGAMVVISATLFIVYRERRTHRISISL